MSGCQSFQGVAQFLAILSEKPLGIYHHLRRFVYAKLISTFKTDKYEWEGKVYRLTKGAIMPEQFPIVNCNPEAVVLLPYRGLFVGNQASGIPTAT
jgi:hypothetical protein